MELNIKKIDAELKRIDENWWGLFKLLKKVYPKSKVSWQLVRYWRDKKSLKGAEPIGKALNINPRDLIL